MEDVLGSLLLGGKELEKQPQVLSAAMSGFRRTYCLKLGALQNGPSKRRGPDLESVSREPQITDLPGGRFSNLDPSRSAPFFFFLGGGPFVNESSQRFLARQTLLVPNSSHLGGGGLVAMLPCTFVVCFSFSCETWTHPSKAKCLGAHRKSARAPPAFRQVEKLAWFPNEFQAALLLNKPRG